MYSPSLARSRPIKTSKREERREKRDHLNSSEASCLHLKEKEGKRRGNFGTRSNGTKRRALLAFRQRERNVSTEKGDEAKELKEEPNRTERNRTSLISLSLFLGWMPARPTERERETRERGKRKEKEKKNCGRVASRNLLLPVLCL